MIADTDKVIVREAQSVSKRETALLIQKEKGILADKHKPKVTTTGFSYH